MENFINLMFISKIYLRLKTINLIEKILRNDNKTDYKQTTISKSTSLKGVGLHTGKNVTLKFLPAGANFGLAFKRVDLEGEPIIKADANYVTNTQSGTCLEKNGVIYTNMRTCSCRIL